jgi:hypothetical protein
MRFILEPWLVVVEEDDTDLSIAYWLIQNTSVPYTDIDTSMWTVQPRTNTVIVLGNKCPVLRWEYDYKEGGKAKDKEAQFEQVWALLVSQVGEEAARSMIAKRAVVQMNEEVDKRSEEFYRNINSSTWEGRDVPTKE